MRDRVPLYPGRVKMVPVAGQENVYDMTRADQPTQEGDPLNKATLLKDATAALFGLGADSVPDDVLAYVGKYAQHWWAKYSGDPGSYELYELTNYLSWDSSEELEYASSIKVSARGQISLVSPKKVSGSSIKGNPAYNNKFFKGTFHSGSINEPAGFVYFIFVESTSDISFNSSYNRYYFFGGEGFKAIKASSGGPLEFVDYVQSHDRHAYPDSGEQNGYEYQYLGIPFDNAVTAPKIATGSYVGTGTYGADNPNSLTFDGIPKMVCVFDSTGSGFTENGGGFIWIQGNVGSTSYNDNKFTQIGNTLSWYTDTAQNQLNNSGKTYVYLALI